MPEPTASTPITLAQFGRSFQEKTLQALLLDPRWAEQLMEIFDETYFDVKYLSFLAERYFAYAKRYRVFPTLQLLVTIVKDELRVGTDILLRDQIITYLQRIKSDPDLNDLPYVKERVLEFAKKQALRRALENAVDQLAGDKYEQIVEGIKKAVMVGTTPSLGHDFFTDYEARFTRLSRNCVPTGIDELDKRDILNGGAGAGEVSIVMSATGVGKSHFLTMLGANALRQGTNVLHYTFELSETAIGVRYDSNLCDINSNTVVDSKEQVLDKYKDMKLGRLIIKEFPPNTATIYTLRSHIERLEMKGFKPGIIIIDYADIMRSTRQYDSLRHELKLVYEELRGLAVEKQLPIWSASQSNKEGSNTDIVDLGNMSEAYGKAMVADFVVSLSRRAHEKSSGWGRLYVAKNRAGRDGLVYPIKIDTSKSKFEIVGQAGTFEAATVDDEKTMRASIKQRLNELKSMNDSNVTRAVPSAEVLIGG